MFYSEITSSWMAFISLYLYLATTSTSTTTSTSSSTSTSTTTCMFYSEITHSKKNRYFTEPLKKVP
jgi:hypothetical protein